MNKKDDKNAYISETVFYSDSGLLKTDIIASVNKMKMNVKNGVCK